MKNYFNEYKLNEYNPVTLLLISLAESIGGSLASEFGTRSGSTKAGTGGLVITIIGFLIVPRTQWDGSFVLMWKLGLPKTQGDCPSVFLNDIYFGIEIKRNEQ